MARMGRRRTLELHCRRRGHAVPCRIYLHKLGPSMRNGALLLECQYHDVAHRLRIASVLVRLDLATGVTIGLFVHWMVTLQTRSRETILGRVSVVPAPTSTLQVVETVRLDNMLGVRHSTRRGMIVANLALIPVEGRMIGDRTDIDRLITIRA